MAVDPEILAGPVQAMLRENMGLKDGESVLVLTDVPAAAELSGLDLAAAQDFLDRVLLARAVATLAARAFRTADVQFVAYPSVGQHGRELSTDVAAKMAESDVVLALTTYSLTHTDATARAAKAGARIASMPGITPSMFGPGGPMAVDYTAIREETRRIAALLTAARQVHLTCPAGTDLTFSIEGRSGEADDGFLATPGAWGNLPAGEAYTAPLEGTAEGRLVVRAGWYPGLKENMTLYFSHGEVYRVEGGGQVGSQFSELLGLVSSGMPDTTVRARRNCAELGIGTNPNARTPDNVLEAEKIRGTIHIAIGDSSHVGGQTPADLHEDFIIPEPDVYFDGQLFMHRGVAVL